MKKAYFIGIAGKTMGPLAKAFKDIGWEVSGSDHVGIYPPISTYLQKNGIKYFEGYDAKNVPHEVDLVVVSRPSVMFDTQNPEYLKAKSLRNVAVLSYPEVLQKYLIKENSIVIAGTYGKTTISALVSWILINSEKDPSYMTGGVPINMEDGVKITNSYFSAIEGDETPSLLETDPSKFMFYQPKYLLLTATHWDHPEVFKSEEAYLQAFINLVRLLPKDGLLVYNLDNVSQKVVTEARCRQISYSFNNDKADYFIKGTSPKESGTIIELNKGISRLETLLLGKANWENVSGAVALALEMGITPKVIESAVKTFKGIKTRLEFLGNFSGRYFYWDIAQHPQKVKGSLEALREHYQKNKIICIFDPVTSGLKYKESLAWYPGAFDQADEVVVGKVGFLKEVKGKKRVKGVEIVEAIKKTQKNVFYQPIAEKIVTYLTEETKPEDVIIFMSSGGLDFTQLINKVVNYFKK